MTCKDCKHWSYEIKHPNGFRHGECDKEPAEFELMKSYDMLGTEAEKVITGEDFGCIHWCPKK